MSRLMIIVATALLLGVGASFAQTKPDLLGTTWTSNYGHMNWGVGAGWYGSPLQLLFGGLKRQSGKWVYEGRYEDIAPGKSDSRGTFFFEFSRDGRSFTGTWTNAVSGRSGSWSGEVYHGDAYPEVTAYQLRFGVPLCKRDLYARGKRDAQTNSACSIPKEWNGMNIDGLIHDMNYEKFHEACRLHDICYSSPWTNRGAGDAGKAACDAQFLSDLQQACNDQHNDGSPRWMRCRAAGRTLSVAVNNFSAAQFGYDSGQDWSSRHCE